MIIVIGILIICIPIGWQLYNKNEQNKMIEEVKKQIQENREKSTTNQQNDAEPNESDPEEEYQQIELEENVQTEDSTSEDKTLTNILKYQNVIGLIEIKKIGIYFPVVEGTERANIRAAIGHVKGSAVLGDNGNCVLAGHRGGIYGELFLHINKLKNGDEVKVTDVNGDEYTYYVYDQFIVKPTDMSVIKWIDGEKTLTLISCQNDGKLRLIVRCRL